MEPEIKCAPPTRSVPSLATKIAEVISAVGYVAKDGENKFHAYRYASAAAIRAAVRQEMAKRHLTVHAESFDAKWETVEKQGKASERICTLMVKFCFTDGDTGEVRVVPMIGQGIDSGDKAFYKAMTGATKYVLIDVFMLPTCDDPEAEEEAGPRASEGQKPRQTRTQRLKDTFPPAPVVASMDAPVTFASIRDRPVSALSTSDLRELMTTGKARLEAHPKGTPAAPWMPKLIATLGSIEHELNLRDRIVPPIPSDEELALIAEREHELAREGP